MANPRYGKYGMYDWKHDCPVPLNGCSYPDCHCDVDDNEISASEK